MVFTFRNYFPYVHTSKNYLVIELSVNSDFQNVCIVRNRTNVKSDEFYYTTTITFDTPQT